MIIDETTNLLIQWLNIMKIDFDDKRAILLMLDNEEKELKMLEWFLENRNPTKRQILCKARNICMNLN